MYNIHKVISFFIFVISFTLSYVFKLVTNNISSDILTITSIILGFYIAALASLFDNGVIKEMAHKQDKRKKSKTELGVLVTYYKSSISISFLVIILSLICLVLKKPEDGFLLIIYKSVHSLMFSLLFVSLYFMYILLSLFINIFRTSPYSKK